jgi:DNA-binding PadR family transcriptional regulator
VVLPLRPPRGGFLRPFGCGEFIRAFLLGEGPEESPIIDPHVGAPIDDIRSAYKAALLRSHAEDMVALAMERGIELSTEEALRRIPQRLTKVRSHSFYRYFHLLKQLGWVEATGEEEGSFMGGMPGARVERTPEGTTLVEVPQPRRYYRLTARGIEAPDAAWSDPLQAIYAYPRETRSQTKSYPRPGTLPRSAKRRSNQGKDRLPKA